MIDSTFYMQLEHILNRFVNEPEESSQKRHSFGIEKISLLVVACQTLPANL